MNTAGSRSALRANARSQPRAVEAGPPSRTAIRRCPCPAAFALLGLAECPNAIISPHLDSATRHTRSEMARLYATNAVAAAAGNVPPNAINPYARLHPGKTEPLDGGPK